ncbi:MAG: sulfide/dihydroorotate dehydrogenase-like FAD/NAD-binding protein [Planctomycetota bacterium]
MMFEVVEKRELAKDVYFYRIQAPAIASRRKAGQFVILRAHERGERIPLTLVGSDVKEGTITIVFQAVGRTTREFAALGEGDAFLDVVGPLGNPTHIERYGTVACVGGGIGIAPVLPIVAAMKEAGNRVISILGARTKDLLILEDEVRAVSDETLVTTDDGSYGRKGFVTDVLGEILGRDSVDMTVAVGPPVMMRAVARLTKERQVRNMVSLNPIMIDGTGMCGGCRVTVGGKRRFVCVDGPEFDGHEVDFDELMKRLKVYEAAERVSLEHMGSCQLEKAKNP